MKPYPLLIQKNVDKAPVIDTYEAWQIVCKDFPFKLGGDAKDLYAESLPDEHGDDEYIPDIIPIGAYEIDVPFVYKGSINTANHYIKQFLHYLLGLDGYKPDLKIYDTYTKIGRQKVRYVGYKDDAFVRKDDEGDVVEFTMSFKVNDPLTEITLEKDEV